jgi:hypothetical protein
MRNSYKVFARIIENITSKSDVRGFCDRCNEPYVGGKDKT